MMFNITPSTGVFLDLLVSELKPKRILELGTSNGYSTIWLACAARIIGALVGNATSHPQELLEIKRYLSDHFGLLIVILPIGNGQIMLWVNSFFNAAHD